jgi:NTE family protein
MGTVILGPERAAAGSRPRIGLVLGAGGVLGAAWMTGALPSLQRRLPCAISDVDVMIGTSAGSVLAAALRCRAGLDEMLAYQRGESIALLPDAILPLPRSGPLPPLPHWRVGSLPLLRAAVLTPHRVHPAVGASAWLPVGRGQHVEVRALIHALHQRARQDARQEAAAPGSPPHWVDGHTWIVAVDYHSGRRVIFGREGAPSATLPDAVVASCSIPGWYEPAVIDGRRYVDGGVRSPTSLGVMAQADVDEVYVLAPMASLVPDRPARPHERLERRLRRLFTRALLREAQALRSRGIRVTLLTPGPEDLAVMGINLMDQRRRLAVLETSLRTSATARAGWEQGQPQAA